MRSLLALTLVLGFSSANAQLGEVEIQDELTGVYKINRKDSVAIIKKVMVTEGDLLNPPVYQYQIQFEVDDYQLSIEAELTPDAQGNLSTHYSDDCDDPGCTESNGDITVLKQSDGRATLEITQDWYRNEGGDETEAEGYRTITGRRIFAGIEKAQAEKPLLSEPLKNKVFASLASAVDKMSWKKGYYTLAATIENSPMIVYKSASVGKVPSALFVITNTKVKTTDGIESETSCVSILSKDSVAWKVNYSACGGGFQHPNNRY